MTRALLIHEADTVAVAVHDLTATERVELGADSVTLCAPIPAGHKFARRRHAEGDAVIKYGYAIGRATRDIAPGEHVHEHNLATALSADDALACAVRAPSPAVPLVQGFHGYLREDGRAATRNELWIVPTVGCVARTAETLAARFRERLPEFPNVEGVHAFAHPFGCSQLGADLENTQRILARLATHPNAGGVLVLGLGCESNHLQAFQPFLGDHDASRIRFLSAQAASDEYEQGLDLLEELSRRANQYERVALPFSKLVIGLKCGGSDGFSGITANPLLGRFASRLAASGGTALLTEVPEMFGAEAAFLPNCVDRDVLARARDMIVGFRRYYAERGLPISENPSPGNKSGGITTLEEKSLGCVQKGGQAPITDVVAYGARAMRPGLTLLQAPGNDAVSTTALVAAGATLVLFTTGRGTPLGSPVPTLKVATNSALARKKTAWIDFDAGALLEGVPANELDSAFAELVLSVASGARTRNERYDQRDIAIFKDGVTL